MSTLNISLPDSMRAYIEQKVSQGSYSTASEYIRQLVREDQQRAAKERLELLLMEGAGVGTDGRDDFRALGRAETPRLATPCRK